MQEARRRRSALCVSLVLATIVGCTTGGGAGESGGTRGSFGPASDSSGRRDAWLLEEDWLEVKTANFTIWSSWDEEDSRELGRQLELFRAVVEFIVGKSLPTSPVPINVYTFASRSGYISVASRDVLGYFTQTLRDNTIVIGPRSMHRGRADPLLTVQHEYLHFLLHNHADFLYPKWYDEGFAEFLSQVTIRREQVEIGSVAPGRVPRRGSDWIELADLFALEYGDRVDEAQFYAQSWALVHYLNFGRSGARTTAQLTRYLRAREKGASVEEAVEQGFETSIDDLDAALRRYVRRGRFKSLFVPIENFEFDETVEIAPMSRVRAAVALGDLSMQVPKAEQAFGYYQAALEDDPSDLSAKVGLGMAHWATGRTDAALQQFAALAADAPDDARVQLALGHFVSAQAEALAAEDPEVGQPPAVGTIDELARRARSHYVKSWKLDESIPETYAAYGATYLLPGQEPQESLVTLRHAHTMLPSSSHARLLLAKAYYATGELQEARELALSLLVTIHGESVGEEITGILKATGGVPVADTSR